MAAVGERDPWKRPLRPYVGLRGRLVEAVWPPTNARHVDVSRDAWNFFGLPPFFFGCMPSGSVFAGEEVPGCKILVACVGKGERGGFADKNEDSPPHFAPPLVDGALKQLLFSSIRDRFA